MTFSIEDELKITEAMEFAAVWHEKANNRRKISNIPYIIHPADVSARFVNKFSEHFTAPALRDGAIVAWLHDLVEDAGVSVIQISEKFGPRIARMVSTLTEDKNMEDREERRVKYLEQLMCDSGDVEIAVKLCDIASNSVSILYSNKDKVQFKRHKRFHDEKMAIVRAINAQGTWSRPVLEYADEVFDILREVGLSQPRPLTEFFPKPRPLSELLSNG